MSLKFIIIFHKKILMPISPSCEWLQTFARECISVIQYLPCQNLSWGRRMNYIAVPLSENKANQKLQSMSAIPACHVFIQLKHFASPNYSSASQTNKLGMLFGHCSLPEPLCPLLPGYCFACIEFSPQSMYSHCTDHQAPVQT